MNEINRPPGRIWTRRLTLAAGASMAFAVTLNGCAMRSTDVAQEVTATKNMAANTPGLYTYGFTRTAQTLTVPPGVTGAQLIVTGAGGGGGVDGATVDGRHEFTAGRGVSIVGRLALTPGDTLTLGVGGRGGAPDGYKAPGAGGWAYGYNWAGGQGGSGHGLAETDGGGGGGSSVVLLNDRLLVVAAGGGGIGGDPILPVIGEPGGGNDGGDGGDLVGQKGFASNENGSGTRGHGASDTLTDLDRTGGTATTGSQGGGGGGGGGVHPGEGGDSGFTQGTGGGGGMSLRSALDTESAANAPLPADGSITVRWLTDGNGVLPPMSLDTHGSSVAPDLAGTPLTLTLPNDATGTVTFIEDADGRATEIGTAPVTAGVAELTKPTIPLSEGSHQVTALYNGDDYYRATATDPQPLTVTKREPSLSLAVGLTNGIAIADGAHLAPLTAHLPADATGSVTFTYTGALKTTGQGSLGTATVDGGNAILPKLPTLLPKGTYTITASYSGDDVFTSATTDKTVGVLR